MLEKLLAKHCGPALAGIKPANMVTCRKDLMPDVHMQLQRLNRELNSKDIYLTILCQCGVRVLVMVYRKPVLEAHLQKPEMRKFLTACGYPEPLTADLAIDSLRKRLHIGSFPHEIGVFLGYPLHDIYGFIHHRDDGCLLTGEWKVYQDAEGAKKLFTRYQACRAAIVSRVEQGYTLAQIFRAA